MCLLALFFRVADDAAVIVGANREEAYARGGEAPRLLAGDCPALAGTDPVAGGTWLGVNALGVLIAITNRLKTDLPKQPRSRGLLARDLLRCITASGAAELATREVGQDRYAGCNILCADSRSAFVLHAGDWLRVRPLPAGLHVLGSRDVNDPMDARAGHALTQLGRKPYSTALNCVSALLELCSDRVPGSPAMCIHGEKGGTVSSSLVALNSISERSIYLHSQGSPDSTPYKDYSPLLHSLLATRQDEDR